ncbi:MAG: O-antigen ligase family protein [Pseudomonadota bacterium]
MSPVQVMQGNNVHSVSRSGSDEGFYGARWWEQVLLALWFYTTFISRPGDWIFLYPLALYFVGSFVYYHHRMVPLALRSILIFLLPILAMLSWGWSAAPADAMRFGIMWALTGVIAIYIAGRFAPHEIIRALFFAGLVTVILVSPEMTHFGRNGPWQEKNIFAVRMVVILVAAMGVAFNRREMLGLRLLAVPLIPTCYLFIIIAQSATSLIFGTAAILAMGTVWIFWSRFASVPHLRSFFLIVLGCLALAAFFFVANMTQNTMYEDFLASLGKDSTLTGRTMLWDAADRIVEEKPLFGVGAEGFWLWRHGEAQTLLELSYKEPGTRFSFHNSYLEVQVHLGLVGLAMLYAVVAWCLGRTILTWLRTQSIVRSFFLLISAIVFISTFTESWLYSVFDILVTIFYVSAISSIMRGFSMNETEKLDAEEHEAGLADGAYGMAE